MDNGTLTSSQTDTHELAIYSGQFEMTQELELAPPPATSSGRPYDKARLLVRMRGEPVGFVTIDLDTEPLSRASVLQAVEREFGSAAKAEAARQGLPGWQGLEDFDSANNRPTERDSEERRSVSVSVVVCTRNRAHILPDCLDSLKRLEHDKLEFVVVDNAPSDSSTRELVESTAAGDARFSYVCEMLPGLSYARNRGLAHARGEIIAYTDDDVRVDPLWVKGLLRGFGRRADVACVTGMVASASLELPVEQYFDGRVGWSSSCEPGVYDTGHGPIGKALHPYAAGAFGTGANFAARTERLRQIGEFDETLGAGTSCQGGEDFDIFVRFILAGYALAYEPAALVWHEHRSGEDDLHRQMYGYGKSLAAYLFKYMSSRRTALDVLRRLPHGLRHLGVLGARSTRVGSQTGLALGPVTAEIRGLAAGPFAYALARRAQDPERRRAVAP
jgi:glycosyltransferase involved in cell wall biosynthesis